MASITERTVSKPGTTARIDALKKQLESDIPQLCLAKARLMTESDKETESEPTVIRTAKALSHILSNMKIRTGDNELIVGDCAEVFGRQACILTPETTCGWLEREMDGLAERDDGKTFISDEDKKTLRELIPYWKGRTGGEKAFLLMPEDLRAKYDRGHGEGSQEVWKISRFRRVTRRWITRA